MRRAPNTFAPANLESTMPSFTPRLGLTGIGGVSQMTPGGFGVLQRASRAAPAAGGVRRRKKKAAAAGGAKKKRRRKGGGGSKLKKGSAAAKAYMAKIRKMRK